MPDDRACSECGNKIKQSSKTGVCTDCYPKWYKSTHKDEERARNSAWYAEHREEKLAKDKENYDPVAKKIWRAGYYEENREKELADNKAWREADKLANPEKWKQLDAETRQKRKESGYNSAYYEANKEKILKSNSEYQKNNKESINAHTKERYDNDVQFKLKAVLRSRFHEAIKNNQKVGSAIRDLGCSIEELEKYLESKFYPNPVNGEPMDWSKWSNKKDGWQIDHIIPFKDFDLTDPEQVKKVCHYTNLRPFWYEEHLEKSIEERRCT